MRTFYRSGVDIPRVLGLQLHGKGGARKSRNRREMSPVILGGGQPSRHFKNHFQIISAA